MKKRKQVTDSNLASKKNINKTHYTPKPEEHENIRIPFGNAEGIQIQNVKYKQLVLKSLYSLTPELNSAKQEALKNNDFNSLTLPVPLPVSLSRQYWHNILHDGTREYTVTNKTDGIHYLLLFTTILKTPRCFLINRRMDVVAVEVNVTSSLLLENTLVF